MLGQGQGSSLKRSCRQHELKPAASEAHEEGMCALPLVINLGTAEKGCSMVNFSEYNEHHLEPFEICPVVG